VTDERGPILDWRTDPLACSCCGIFVVGFGGPLAFYAVLMLLLVINHDDMPADSDPHGTGWSLHPVGDVDGDGTADFALSTRFDPVSAQDRPSTFVLTGASWDALYAVRFEIRWSDGEFARRDLESSVAHFGPVSGLLALGDLDGDGCSDFCVGLEEESTRAQRGGALRMLSGKSGARLWEIQGTADDERMGRALANAGDLDGDGHDDLLVGVLGGEWHGRPGRVEQRSGRSGASLGAIEGERVTEPKETFPNAIEHHAFGAAVCMLGDLDADGTGDFAVGAPWMGDSGAIFAYSGASRTLLWSRYGQDSDGFGSNLSVTSDLDGDGHVDLLTSSYGRVVRSLSGASGYRINAHPPWAHLIPLGDLDADGQHEAFGRLEQGADVTLLTGKAFEPVWTMRPTPGFDEPHHELAPAGLGSLHDVDGDGVRDLYAISDRHLDYEDGAYVADFGVLRIHSGRDGSVLREITRATLREALQAGCPVFVSSPDG